ncbi:DUF2199 domain-containing protein [Paenibacillus sp. Soil522]|uniref:DUF2199 domain-containing protein n=1 Tax=Paenibacillus sp. Soil522 TaxID=1736388 RepID=UPI0006FF8D9E|nr:DUF2199 domain-containing protein [Paenibacillus sp. Soil522]KRE49512.1 hypothetical protein ASG81_04725 [Paenibacillus sp. Soil522]
MNNNIGFECSCCGEFHELPMSYGSPAPYYWYGIDPGELDERSELTSDQCVIEEKYFFIRGCIEIPVYGQDSPFIWDVWVSLSEENFLRTNEFWDEESREEIVEPMFGWLSTSLPCYPETLNVKTMVNTRSVGIRPYIELEPTDHPLAIEQTKGIYMTRVQEIAEILCRMNEA